MIETTRLVLRPFCAHDVPVVQRLANNRAVSRNTSRLPHPYTHKDAEQWIQGHGLAQQQGRGRPWAVTTRHGHNLIGAIELDVEPAHNLGVLGYWLGQASWGQGYATEAARAVVAHGFENGLAKVAAEVLETNSASMIVLQRCGLRLEGVLRSHHQRDDKRLDVHCYGRLTIEA